VGQCPFALCHSPTGKLLVPGVVDETYCNPEVIDWMSLIKDSDRVNISIRRSRLILFPLLVLGSNYPHSSLEG